MVPQIKEKPIRSNICREGKPVGLRGVVGGIPNISPLPGKTWQLLIQFLDPPSTMYNIFSPFPLSSLSQARKDEQLQKRRNLQVEPDETPLQESNKTVPLDLSLPAIVTVSPPPPHTHTHTHTTQWSLWYCLVSLVQYISRQAGKW